MWGFLAAIVTAIAAYGHVSRRRNDALERRVLGALRARGPISELRDDGSVVVSYRGLPVTVHFGVPEGRDWSRGLVARAPYAIGAGPKFEAAPHDITAHTRPANGTSLLRARFEHHYDVTGDHREVRTHLLSVLDRTDSSDLPAPLFSTDHSGVRVHLPEHVPGTDRASTERCLAQLVALTGELAFFGADVLARYAEAIGGNVVLDRSGSPVLSARFSHGETEGVMALRWVPVDDGADDAFRFQLRLSSRRLGASPVELAAAIRDLGDLEERAHATRLLARAEVAQVGPNVELSLGSLPSPDELPTVARVLALLVHDAPPEGPFR